MMKRRNILSGLVAAVALSVSVGVQASDGWHHSIRERVQAAESRIDRGVEQGSLTRHEAHRLRSELRGILHRIDRMRSDGRLSERERQTIHHDLDRLDRDIYREKHDSERSWGRR